MRSETQNILLPYVETETELGENGSFHLIYAPPPPIEGSLNNPLRI